jgi:hypothetical protein
VLIWGLGSILFFILVLVILIIWSMENSKYDDLLNQIYKYNPNIAVSRKYLKQKLKDFNNTYTQLYNYNKYKSEYIFKCTFLTKNQINSSFYDEYNRMSGSISEKIRDEAVEKIKVCFWKIYVIKSAILYFEEHIQLAKRTITLINTNSFYRQHLTPILKQRTKYLEGIIYHSEKIIVNLNERERKIRSAIKELEKIKKPTIFDIAINIITAPFRHTFNMIDSLITGNDEKFIRSGVFLGLTFLGAGLIGDAIDALDAIDSTDFTSVELDTDIHHVESHSVDGYVRADGTVVDSYFRGGEEGYLRTNPDGMASNNLRS